MSQLDILSLNSSLQQIHNFRQYAILTHPTPPTSSPPPTPYSGGQLTEQEIIIGVAIAAAVIIVGLGLLIYLIKRK
jgi:hypothetical protein